MSTFLDSRELTATEFLALMRSEAMAGNREYDDLRRAGLIYRSGIWMSPETASALEAAMSALPNIPRVRRPIRAPEYVTCSLTLESAENFREANEQELRRYFGELPVDGESCSFDDFCVIEYEKQRFADEEELSRVRYGANTWQDRDADEYGVALTGPI